jgi:tRNA dimethylallyltransferase
MTSSTLLDPELQKEIKEIQEKKPRIIVIAGPTGVGKSALAIRLCQLLSGEVISADSCQVYKGMDIGTAKVTEEEKQGIEHHLIDICDIEDEFNVVEFYKEAFLALRNILARKKIPIIVGGSGYYLHTFLYGPPEGPPADKAIREHLEKQMEKYGPEVLYERLQMIDPEYAKTVTENDRHKIIRGLEIIQITKKQVSDFPRPMIKKNPYFDARCWFLYYPREILYPRLEKRCDEMLQKGFIEEVKWLKEQGIEKNPSASMAIGYRQALEFLKTNQSDEEKEKFIIEFKKATRHFVKRQFTYFRKEKDFRWMDLSKINLHEAEEYILQDYEQGI